MVSNGQTLYQTLCHTLLDPICNMKLPKVGPHMQHKFTNNRTLCLMALLLVCIKHFKPVAACLVLQKCFSLSKHISKYLQSEEVNFTIAIAAVEDPKATFELLCSEDELKKPMHSSLRIKFKPSWLRCQSDDVAS